MSKEVEKPEEVLEIVNLSQAIGVLLEAVSIGVENGVYKMNDLELILSARKFILDLNAKGQEPTKK